LVAVFIGTFENKVDRKGRISVPAPFRQTLSGMPFQGIVAFPSRRVTAIEACGMDLMEDLIAQQSTGSLLSDTPEDPASPIFYDLQQLAFDGDGRVILPQAFREFAGIETHGAFVGVGKLFQIWDPKRLADYRSQRMEGR
jgi:MraZ protein